MTSLLDGTKSQEVDAAIDTGATLLVLPQDLVEELGLTKIRDVRVRYGNNSVEAKGVYGAVTLDLKGRRGIFEALAEAPGSEPLVGQVVLECLDLTVDPRTPRVRPNPLSSEMPTVEILGQGRSAERRAASRKQWFPVI